MGGIYILTSKRTEVGGGKRDKKKHETSKQSKRDRNALKEQRAHSEMVIRLQPHTAPPHRSATGQTA